MFVFVHAFVRPGKILFFQNFFAFSLSIPGFQGTFLISLSIPGFPGLVDTLLFVKAV